MAVVFIDLDGTLTHTSDIRYKEYKDGLKETNPSTIPVFQGAVEFIKNLQQSGHRVIILSDSHPKYVRPIVDYWFKVEYVYLSDKPNTSKTLSFINGDNELRELYSNKNNFFIIGDSALDIQLARKMGIPSILALFYRHDSGEYDSKDMVGDERMLIKYGPTYIAKSYSEISQIISNPSSSLLSIEAIGQGSHSGRALKFWNNKNRTRVVAFRCLGRQENGTCDKFAKADWYYQIDNPNRTKELLQNLAQGVSDYIQKLTNFPNYTWDYFTYVSDKATTTPPKKMQEIFDLVETSIPKITLFKWNDNMSSSIRSHINYADRQSFIRENLHLNPEYNLAGKNIKIIADQQTTGATAFEIWKKLEERSIGNIVFVTLFYMILEVKDDKVCPICGKPLSIKINRKKGTKFYSCQPAQFGGEGCGYIENI